MRKTTDPGRSFMEIRRKCDNSHFLAELENRWEVQIAVTYVIFLFSVFLFAVFYCFHFYSGANRNIFEKYAFNDLNRQRHKPHL